MALPASGTITMAQVNTELGQGSTTSINLNQASVRSLFAVPSGTIAMSNGYGKSSASYTTLNPADKSANVTLSNGNLTATFSGTGSVRGISVAPASNNVWRYYEATIVSGTSGISVGMGKAAASLAGYPGQNSNSDGMRSNGVSNIYPSFIGLATNVYGAGSVVSWAFSGSGVRLYVNGVNQFGAGCEAANFYPMIGLYSYNGPTVITCNFGSSAFVYTGLGMGGWIA